MIGLWAELARSGARLGGMTGPIVLREVGKDTFLLSPDVVTALRRAKVVAEAPTSKKDLALVQDAFVAWKRETGRPFCQLSRILAASV